MITSTADGPGGWDRDIMTALEEAIQAGVPAKPLIEHLVGVIDAYVEAYEPIQRCRGRLPERLSSNAAPEGQQERARQAVEELEAAYLSMVSSVTMAGARFRVDAGRADGLQAAVGAQRTAPCVRPSPRWPARRGGAPRRLGGGATAGKDSTGWHCS